MMNNNQGSSEDHHILHGAAAAAPTTTKKESPSPRFLTPFVPVIFIRLGAIVRGLPSIITKSEREKDGHRYCEPFRQIFMSNFQAAKNRVVLRKHALAALNLFDEHGMKVCLVTRLPSRDYVQPVLQHIKTLAPTNKPLRSLLAQPVIHAHHTHDLHLCYAQMLQKMHEISSNSPTAQSTAGLVFGFEHPDTLLANEANRLLAQTHAPSIVVPLIHARQTHRDLDTAHPTHLDLTDILTNTGELIKVSQCLNTKAQLTGSQQRHYFESRHMGVLAMTAVRMAHTLGKPQVFDSFPCN